MASDGPGRFSKALACRKQVRENMALQGLQGHRHSVATWSQAQARFRWGRQTQRDNHVRLTARLDPPDPESGGKMGPDTGLLGTGRQGTPSAKVLRPNTRHHKPHSISLLSPAPSLCIYIILFTIKHHCRFPLNLPRIELNSNLLFLNSSKKNAPTQITSQLYPTKFNAQ